MSWLAKLKSVLGFGNRGSRRSKEYGDQPVSFERARDTAPAPEPEPEPETERERAVKQPEPTAEAVTTDDEATSEPTPDHSGGTDTPVQEIKGIGPAYAKALGEAGIETTADLASADAATLAAETDLSETRIQDWIDRARAR